MNENEKRILTCAEESVIFCLQRGIDKKQIAEWLDDVIMIYQRIVHRNYLTNYTEYKIIYYLGMNCKGEFKMKSKEYFNLLQDLIILCESNKTYNLIISHKDALRLKRLLERYSKMKIEDLRDLYK